MQVLLNGESRDITPNSTLLELLESLGLREPHVAIAVNRDIIRRSDYPARRLREGDRIEIVHAVGGG
ncbi:MAG: sulfur carrier protein ThiS [Vicinamibacteria bacterium]